MRVSASVLRGMKVQGTAALVAVATYALFYLSFLVISAGCCARAQSLSSASISDAQIDAASDLDGEGSAGHRRLQTGTQSLRYPTSTISSLPAFSPDNSEFALSALIERKDNSYDLWATTILFAHRVVVPSESAEEETFWRIDEQAAPKWRRAIAIMNQTEYNMRKGLRRVDPKFICRIMVAVTVQGDYVLSSTESYDVPAEVVPNAAIGDVNARWRHDILRCKLRNPKDLYAAYAGTDAMLQVELLKGEDQHSLLTYHIPWKSRLTGYMALQPDPVANRVEKSFKGRSSKRKLSIQQQMRRTLAYQHSSMNIDPWKGYSRTPSSSSKLWDMDAVYLCVPGWLSPLSIKNLPHMVEFLQHHINQGVRHVFLGAAFSWHSPHMQLLMRSLRSFFQQGQLSISSHSADDVDFRFSAGGAFAHTDAMKIYYATLMLYFSKGMSRYLAVWDFDEFYVPQQSGQTLASLLTQFPINAMASKHAHPFCFLELESETMLKVDAKELSKTIAAEGEQVDINTAFSRRPVQIWFRNNFQVNAKRPRYLAHRKAIHPTFRAFHAGLHNSGACDLSDYYAAQDQAANITRGTETPLTEGFNRARRFSWSDLCDRGHAIVLDKRNQGLIYHVQFFRSHLTLQLSEASTPSNRYASEWSNAALTELHRRGLYHPLSSFHHPGYLVDLPNTHYPTHRVVNGWPEPLGEHPLFPLRMQSISDSSVSPICDSLPVFLSRGVVISARLVAVNDHADWFLLLRYLDHPLGHLRFSHNLPYEAVEAAASSRTLDVVVCHVSISSPAHSSESASGAGISSWRITAVESPPPQQEKGGEASAPVSGRLYLCPLPAELTNYLKSRPEERLQVQLQAQTVSTTTDGAAGLMAPACFTLPAASVGVGSMYPLPLSPSPSISSSTISSLPQPNENDDADANFLDLPLLSRQESFQRQALASSKRDAASPRDGHSLLPFSRAHLCVAGGWGGADAVHAISRTSLAPLMEFLHHHLMLGVQRIYLPVHIPSGSLSMRRLTSALRSLIRRQQVVLWSTDTLIRANLTSTIGNVTSGQVRYYRGHLREQVVQECFLHAWQAGAQHLGVWDSHQIFIPVVQSSEAIENLYRGMGLHAWYEENDIGRSLAQWIRLFAAESSTWTQSRDATASQAHREPSSHSIPVASMQPRDWIFNKFQSAEDYRKAWMGDIYRSDLELTNNGAPTLTSEMGEWLSLPAEIRTPTDLLHVLERLRTASESGAASHPQKAAAGISFGILLASYDLDNPYHYHDRQDEESCQRIQSVLARYETIAKGDRNAFFRQMQRVWTLFCSSFPSSVRKEAIVSEKSSISNIYSKVFFPLVYASLADEDRDLYVDAWPTNPSGLVSDFTDATLNLLPYKKLYAQVMEEMTTKPLLENGVLKTLTSWL